MILLSIQVVSQLQLDSISHLQFILEYCHDIQLFNYNIYYFLKLINNYS